ncbi:hypothetical protein A6U86_33035 [Rhizobium sp. AC27/96]|uniref:SMP-30/gluconolactonase/LRE family protein n=1 Tax=Rhizobium TaxID=379 RepID=UPI000828DA6D|nr:MULTISPECIES: SMP-30/gluconolactonase/LRE family protein [Rhizobium]NTF46650.1 SMP-30/gluconolactonase/LRE family protein [Rhizobium rhizogenes]OCI99392.1 hypothetical protein A6U86_33035 [Rhizobium sp. AC27/96]
MGFLSLSPLSGRSHLLGEGPRWIKGALWWIDIEAGELWSATSADDIRCAVKLPYQIGSFAVTMDDRIILATRNGFELYVPSSAELKAIVDPQPTRMTRFNDGRVDPAGRFWAGTMAIDPARYAEPLGSLYCLDDSGKAVEKLSGLTISNGIDWSNDARTMYLNDTMRGLTLAFDFDCATGAITNKRPFAIYDRQKGLPDGLLVDADDHVWTAVIGSGEVMRFCPDGSLDAVMDIGTSWPTALTFGGDDFSTLYVTTSRHLMDREHTETGAGLIYQCSTSWRGRPENLVPATFDFHGPGELSDQLR